MQVNDFLKYLFYGYMLKDIFKYCFKTLYIDIDQKEFSERSIHFQF